MVRRFWPVPRSYSKVVPERMANGSFKMNDYYGKLDIWHTGIDIFAPAGAEVIAAEDCAVIGRGQFTGAPDSPEYRKTWHVTVRNDAGDVIVYGEVRKPKLRIGQMVKAGGTIGRIAVVERAKNAPEGKRRAMLHFELYKKGTEKTVDWWYKGEPKPEGLLDPTRYLKSARSATWSATGAGSCRPVPPPRSPR